MSTTSLLRRARRHVMLSRGVVRALCLLAMSSCAAAPVAGCSNATTRIDGAKTGATHETRQERPGRTIERKIELRIPTPRPETAPDDGQPTSDQVAFTPVIARGLTTIASVSMPAIVGGSKTPTPITNREIVRDAIDAATYSNTPIELVITETENVPASADTTSSSLQDDGASLRTSSDEAAVDFESRQGKWQLPWAKRRGGGGSFGISAQVFGDSGMNALHIVGSLVLLAAIVPLVMMPRRVGLAATLAGAGLMIIAAGTVAEQYPWILAIALVVFIGVLGYLAYEAWRSGRLRSTLTAVTRAVEYSPNPDAVKSQVARESGSMGHAHTAEIRAAKRRGNVRTSDDAKAPVNE